MAVFGNGGIFGNKRAPDPTGYDLNAQLTNKLLFDEPGPANTAGEMPKYPGFSSLLKADGKLDSSYALNARPDVGFSSNLNELNSKLNGIQLNKQGLEEIRKRALTAGPSEWQQLMLQKQKLEEDTAKQEAAVQNATANSEGMSSLASKGGLSSGARERMATQGARNYARSLQDVGRTGQGQRLDIAVQDENQKLDLLKSLPGMEVQALSPELQKTSMWSGLAESEAGRKQNLDLANRDYSTGVDQFNLNTVTGDIKRGDDARMTAYQEKMKAYAAAKQADATTNSGGKSGSGKK